MERFCIRIVVLFAALHICRCTTISACAELGGVCLDKAYDQCRNGSYISGKCPGPENIKCCTNNITLQDTVSCANTAVLSRDTWGARNPISINQLQSPVGMVFIHHTDGLSCTTVERCVSILKGIQRFHIDTRGWDDIAYSFLVGEDGRIYEGRGWRTVGSHTKGYNSRSLAISVMGTFSNVVPNKAALDAVRSLLTCARNDGYIESSYTLYGHRDVGTTECPGAAFYNIIRSWPHYNGTSGGTTAVNDVTTSEKFDGIYSGAKTKILEEMTVVYMLIVSYFVLS